MYKQQSLYIMYKLTFLNSILNKSDIDLNRIANKLISNNVQAYGLSMYSLNPNKFTLFTKEDPNKIFDLFKSVFPYMTTELLTNKKDYKMIYLNKDDVGKNVYKVVRDYNVQVAYFVKAKDVDEAEDLVRDYGGLKLNNDSFNVDSEQLELDFYNDEFGDMTTEHLGKVIVDTNDQDEVELDKYATERV